MLYFYDNSGRYIGSRARIANELIPECATETPVDVPDGYEAHWDGTQWAVTEIAADTATVAEAELTDIDKLKVRTTATEDAITAILDMMMGV